MIFYLLLWIQSASIYMLLLLGIWYIITNHCFFFLVFQVSLLGIMEFVGELILKLLVDNYSIKSILKSSFGQE